LHRHCVADSRNARDLAILMALTAMTRWAFRSHFLYDIDSVNFALALGRFDPRVYQPHPPGYFLYVRLGMLAHSIFHDPNTALTAISILASCGAVAMIHVLASIWFGRAAAAFAAMIFVCSPLAWFYGTVALTYIVEAFFSALIGYLCWRVYCGAARFVFPAAALLGVAAGFRQSSLLVLTPLLMYAMGSVSPKRAWGKRAWAGISILLLTLAAWFIPMVYQSGGLQAYVSSLWSLWRLVPARQTVFTSSIFSSVARFCLILAIFGLSLGSAALLVFRGSKAPSPNGAKTFTWIWISPGLLLFTFVYLKFVNSGYLLVLLPPACVWVGSWAADWYQRSSLTSIGRTALLAGAAAANILIFVRAPMYFSYREVRRSQQELTAVIAALQQIAQPQRTLIVGFDSHFLGYRHAGFYLPRYRTVQFPEVPLASGAGVFTMKDRQTTLVSHLSLDSFRDFIVFPLPSSGMEYGEYMKCFRARFAADGLGVTTLNGIEFVRGPLSALQSLFPHLTFEPAP
jgi:hypothetical protein